MPAESSRSSSPSDDDVAVQQDALAQITVAARRRLADPAYRARMDSYVAAVATDFAGLGGGTLNADVARGYLMGSCVMLKAIQDHTVGKDQECFQRHVNTVWDAAVALLVQQERPQDSSEERR